MTAPTRYILSNRVVAMLQCRTALDHSAGSTSFCYGPFWSCPFCCWSIMERTFLVWISQK